MHVGTPISVSDKETEAQRGQVFAQCHTASKCRSWDSNPQQLDSKLLFYYHFDSIFFLLHLEIDKASCSFIHTLCNLQAIQSFKNTILKKNKNTIFALESSWFNGGDG